MDERVSTSPITLSPAGLNLLRASGVPASLDGAGRTLPIAMSCLNKAQGVWPDAPFFEWAQVMSEVNAELERAKESGLADPIALISAANTSNAVLQEVQRWTMHATTAHEVISLALIGRALVIWQQARAVLPAELLRGLHTLRLAKMQKGRRSPAWDALLDTDLTSADQVLQRLESTPPQSPTRDFLAVLSVVLSTSVQPPNRTEALKSNEHPNGADDPTGAPATAEQVSSSADRGTAQLDSEEVTPDEGQGLPGNVPEKSTSPRISARLAAGDYASVAEKLGLHDRDRLLLDDLVAITTQLVPIVQANNLVNRGFATLAMLSLITCTSDHFTLNMGFEPTPDGLWLELQNGAWSWDYGSYLRSGSTQGTDADITPVRVPMPSLLHQVLSDARQRSPSASTVRDLICVIQGEQKFDLEGYRAFLRGLGDSAHPPYQGRFARSYQSCMLSITGSDMLTALLSASFSMSAPAALFYFGPTYETICSTLDQVFHALGLGPATRLLPQLSRAGCEAIPSEDECRTGWKSLVNACNDLRRQCLETREVEERVRLGNSWMEHLCSAFVLQTAHRGTRLELLTAQALLTDHEFGVIHDKDDTTKRERQHARLLPWSPSVQRILAGATECHAVMSELSPDHAVALEANTPLFGKFSAGINGAAEAVASQAVAQIIAHHFAGAAINVGRAIWVTGLDQAGCDRWSIRGLTGHTRDITRVGDAMFDVSPMETARRLHAPMDDVSKQWFGDAEVQSAPRPRKLATSKNLLVTDERAPKRPGVPDPRTLLHPIDAQVLSGWKLAHKIRTSLLRGELPGSAGVLGLLHLTFLDLLPNPEIGIQVLDPEVATAWHCAEPCPALLWSRPHFKHPVWLPVLPSTWMLLTKATPASREDLLAEVEACIRSSKLTEAFAQGCDVWQVLCSCAKAFRRLEMQPTMQVVSHPQVPSPCLNPQSIARLTSPEKCSLEAMSPRAMPSASRARQARGADLAGVSKVLNHLSNQNLRLGERRQRAILAMEGIEALQVEWSATGEWLKEWILEELVRSRDNQPGCYQISSLSTYLSTLLVDTRWTVWDEPSEWDETDWTAFIELINAACRTPEDDKAAEIVPRAKHALAALVRSLLRRGQHVPIQVLQGLAEPTESVPAWDSASSVLISHEDHARAVELVKGWLADEPATLLLATTRAAISTGVPVRSGEVSSLPWDCLTSHGALVISRTGFNNLKTETSIRAVTLDSDTVRTVQDAKILARVFVPGADLLMRGAGNVQDVELDNRALEHWKAALKTVTSDPKARPHSQRAATLQEMTWPGWQGIAKDLTSGTLTQVAAAAWLESLQGKWHRLAQATSAAGQSGIQSALGNYLAGWPFVHAVQALALLPEEAMHPALLRQLSIPTDRYRQAKGRSARSKDDSGNVDVFCSWRWLGKQTGAATAPPATEGKAHPQEQPSMPTSVPADATDLIKLRYLCLTGLGMPALQAHKELGIPWSLAVRLEQLSGSQEERDACTRRARASPGGRGQQADRELCLSETGEQLLTWLLGLQPELLEFLMLALLRDKPAGARVFDDYQRWQDVMQGMPAQLCLVVRRGQAYVPADAVARALRDWPRFQLVPDPKLGRRPAVRLTLVERDNLVMSARLTSVTRIAVLSLQLLRNQKVTKL